MTTVWIRDTHHPLQKQEFRWECLRQEVREQKKEVQNFVMEGQCIRQNHDRHEERLQQLEKLVSQQGLALVELRTKYENEFKRGRLGDVSTRGSEGKSPLPRVIQRQPTKGIRVGKPILWRIVPGTEGALVGLVPGLSLIHI